MNSQKRLKLGGDLAEYLTAGQPDRHWLLQLALVYCNAQNLKQHPCGEAGIAIHSGCLL